MGQVLSIIWGILSGGKVGNGSAETPGGTSEPRTSATAGLSSTIEEDPPPTTAAALPQKLLITPHFCSIDIEQYYCSYTGDDTSRHQLQEDIFALSSLESSLSDEDDSISSNTNEVDQDTRLVEVVCQVVRDFESEPELWMKQYSSRQKILLVGEGDFSFSASLAAAFGSATNIVSTSLDSEGFLTRNYGSAMANIGCLRGRGAKVFHGVDATEMAENFMFRGMKFDRVVFNFPHAGFFRDESRESQLRRNKNLIRLFMRNAKKMIVEAKGEIHITHKSNGFFAEWNLQQLASSEGLQLKQEEHFNFKDYPGYRTKYGFGGDKNFNCNPSKSYTFGLIKINA
ncbi:uncharacterized protein At4g26485-like [Diospyros lotus]|uniref:uncharacterized protein At4g26485-like n=1 Tax=Diospyros lotus TaxID=55363 RepID=UPI0022542329|nr:uncharacterized protein At4g26485-like [Diospyros lotus]XP_052178336.1 uncharacterized protein At4g26485-like [Diospyros lotus]